MNESKPNGGAQGIALIQQGDAREIITVAKEAAKPTVVELPGHAPFLVTPTGAVIRTGEFRQVPLQAGCLVELKETVSFIHYLLDHKVPAQTILLGDFSASSAGFRAVIDWHERETNKPATAKHQVILQLETTPEWQAWQGASGVWQAQEAFAEFIEANATDIIEPDAASILEMAQLLEGKKTVNFKSGKRLQDGRLQLAYVEEIEVKGGGSTAGREDALQLPQSFKLGLVPFVGQAGIEITARLRFRIGQGGSVAFAYILDRPQQVIREAFVAAREQIEGETGLLVHLGSVRL